MTNSLGDRMKNNYERPYDITLPWRMPVIIRVDGKCFHTFTKKMQKPFDEPLIKEMMRVMFRLCEGVGNCVFAYGQSDEISLLINNYKTINTQPWFDNSLQKMVSITAAIASVEMSRQYDQQVLFDSRAFVLPEAEVNNYFLWRQQDATRNSIQSIAQSLYPHKALEGKNNNQLQEMIFQKGHNFNDYQTYQKRGWCCKRNHFGNWQFDLEIPIFSQNHNYIENLLISE